MATTEHGVLTKVFFLERCKQRHLYLLIAVNCTLSRAVIGSLPQRGLSVVSSVGLLSEGQCTHRVFDYEL